MFPQRSWHIPRSVFPLAQSFGAIDTPTRTFFCGGAPIMHSYAGNRVPKTLYRAGKITRRRLWSLEGEEMVTYPRLSNSPACSLRRTRGAVENVIELPIGLEASRIILELERVPA